MEYKILNDSSIKGLEVQVCNALNSGYQLQGGVSVTLKRTPMATSQCDDKVYYQAVIKL